MKNTVLITIFAMLLGAVLPITLRAQTNLMPHGFESVSLGMSSNDLKQARSAVHDPDSESPVSLMEALPDDTFFDGVFYYFFPQGGLSDIHFIAGTHSENERRQVAAGFVKGCIQKYGTNYEQRVVGAPSSFGDPLCKVAILRWTNQNAVVVASFISEANRDAYRQANKTEIRYLPYKLRIYDPNAVTINGGTNALQDIVISYPANQDTTGQAFTNFPNFLDSYNGPIWQ